MRKRKLLLLIIFFALFCFKTITSKAETFYDGDVYVEVEVAKTNEKIYLDDELASYLEYSGIDVKNETTTTGALWWKKTITKKYYDVNKNMLKVVNVRSLEYDFDTMLYMVEQIENYAIEYKKQTNKDTKVSTLTSGFLRCINPNYYGKKMIYNVNMDKFEVFSRSLDEDFIEYVHENENSKKNTFANYVTIDTYFSNCLNRNFYIYNKNGVYHPIDLIHLFCVIDTFDTREGNFDFILQYRQLTGWLGDLHQAIALVYSYKNENELTEFSDIMDYANIVNDNKFGFDKCDLNADIDGLNIAHYYLNRIDDSDHSLSKAVGTYYSTLHQSNDNLRYKLFVEYVSSLYDNGAAVDFVVESSDRFVSYVYDNCALDFYGNFKGYNSPFCFYDIMKCYGNPDSIIIENVTKSFCKYILERASMSVPGGRV